MLDGVDVSVGPRTRLGVVGPNGVGKTTLLRLLAGLDRPDRGSVTRTPPNARVGYLPQEPERSRARDAARLPGSPHRRARGRTRSSSARPPRWPHQAADADDAYARALDDYLAAGGPDFEARARVDVCRSGSAGIAACTRRRRRCRADRRRGASLAAILLSRFDVYPPRRADQRPRLRRARPPRAVPRRAPGRCRRGEPRPDVPRTRRHARARARRARPQQHRVRRRLARVPRSARATARRHAEEEYAVYRAQRTRLEARARTQRQWAVDGVRTAKTRAPEHDKAQRDFRINASERQAAKARGDRAGDRAPRRRSRSRGRDGTCASRSPTRRGAATSCCASTARWSSAATSVSGPVDLEIGWAERVAIVGPNGSGKTTLLRALLGRSAARRRVSAGSGPA